MEALEVHVRCGVSEQERALPQRLLVDLEYSYRAEGYEELAGVVDYGALISGVAEVLEGEEFLLLETAVARVGEYALSVFPRLLELEVAVAKVAVPVARSVKQVAVRSEFRRSPEPVA